MTHGCKIDKQDGAHFLTLTIVEWLNILKDDRYKIALCESLNYCINEKGLIIYSYVIMSTHMHLIAASTVEKLSDTLRDFKKYTSHLITKMLSEETGDNEAFFLKVFEEAAKKHSRNKKYQVWQQHNHPEEVESSKFTLTKIKYIHNNPVDAGIVDFPEQYAFSSAVDYAGGKGMVQVTLINLHNLY
jgi:REP element-mobilizing transposase RayT